MSEGFVESGGSVPEGGNEPIIVDAPAGTKPGSTEPSISKVGPDGKLNPQGLTEGMADELAKMERELKEGGHLKKSEMPEGEETPTGQTEDEFYQDVAEFAAAHGMRLDKDYASIEDMVLDMYNQRHSLQSEMSKHKPMIDKITKTAETLGIPLEQLPDLLASIDPRADAINTPAFENLNGVLSKYNFENDSYKQLYSDLGNAMMSDITNAVKGQMGRLLRSLDGRINDMDMNFQLYKFMQNDKNAHWRGRDNEILSTIKEYPQWFGKSNAIDLATKLLSESTPQKTITKEAGKIAAEKLAEIEAKKKKFYSEGGGRTPQPGTRPKDISKWTKEQLEAEGQRLEKAGARL